MGTLGRVFVTGGSEFLGRHVVSELLNRGHHVRTLDRVPATIEPNPLLNIAIADICDPAVLIDAVAGVDTVFHTAGVIGTSRPQRIPLSYRDPSRGPEAGAGVLQSADDPACPRTVSGTAHGFRQARPTTLRRGVTRRNNTAPPDSVGTAEQEVLT
ncbi:NAD-dependent epimerase/dehydratase family protein [[Mycobacterium] nativiensis]|uniref:NAD-dependent epimerase/dehydratase family protein n=1 Tax=[Mycobacterium] nativiensis TaxID=2855503 RepID=A0ABU5XV54_9MYCO|nr:NAD-dependent epimerase/dehydratase family protein [Mycolicibacter sp. MYC340]MEB3031869.1 NAD-dependent epimerase/dehydratase family protein [Mycolicibacter sp. MYC340]